MKSLPNVDENFQYNLVWYKEIEDDRTEALEFNGLLYRAGFWAAGPERIGFEHNSATSNFLEILSI